MCEANDAYVQALKYINQYYSFENNPFAILSSLYIKKQDLKFNDVCKAGDISHITIDEDRVYDEIMLLIKYWIA